jgi:hypothetical protein
MMVNDQINIISDFLDHFSDVNHFFFDDPIRRSELLFALVHQPPLVPIQLEIIQGFLELLQLELSLLQILALHGLEGLDIVRQSFLE